MGRGALPPVPVAHSGAAVRRLRNSAGEGFLRPSAFVAMPVGWAPKRAASLTPWFWTGAQRTTAVSAAVAALSKRHHRWLSGAKHFLSRFAVVACLCVAGWIHSAGTPLSPLGETLPTEWGPFRIAAPSDKPSVGELWLRFVMRTLLSVIAAAWLRVADRFDPEALEGLTTVDALWGYVQGLEVRVRDAVSESGRRWSAPAVWKSFLPPGDNTWKPDAFFDDVEPGDRAPGAPDRIRRRDSRWRRWPGGRWIATTPGAPAAPPLATDAAPRTTNRGRCCGPCAPRRPRTATADGGRRRRHRGPPTGRVRVDAGARGLRP